MRIKHVKIFTAILIIIFLFFYLTSFARPQPISNSTTQQPVSNIPTHKPSNNFQQTLPRYNPPPNPHNSSNNPTARRLQRTGRYSAGTATSLIPAPGSAIHQTPLASPALSTTSTAVSAPETTQKSHLQYPPSRIPTDMLKFQVRKSETESTTNTNQPPSSASHPTTNAQIQVIKPSR